MATIIAMIAPMKIVPQNKRDRAERARRSGLVGTHRRLRAPGRCRTGIRSARPLEEAQDSNSSDRTMPSVVRIAISEAATSSDHHQRSTRVRARKSARSAKAKAPPAKASSDGDDAADQRIARCRRGIRGASAADSGLKPCGGAAGEVARLGGWHRAASRTAGRAPPPGWRGRPDRPAPTGPAPRRPGKQGGKRRPQRRIRAMIDGQRMSRPRRQRRAGARRWQGKPAEAARPGPRRGRG